jgi:phospholipid-translocating ATPase
LLAVLAITALKDGYEDVKRHQSDHHVNHSITHILGGGPEPGPDGTAPSGGLAYKNWNAMTAKTKTFMPAIKIPRLRSKKAKAAAKREKQLEKLRAEGVEVSGVDQDEDVGVNSRAIGAPKTEALERGVVDPYEVQLEGARPSGHAFVGSNNEEGDEQFMLQRTVTRPDEDPEAFDDANEVAWKQTIWEDVKVGDFVKIYDNEQLPAGT